MTRTLVVAFAIVAWIFVIPPILSRIIPPTWWYEAGPVFVENGIAGTPPIVVPRRAIHREFTGTWSANVYRVRDGVFTLHCHRRAQEPFRYRPPKPREEPSGAPESRPGDPSLHETGDPIDMNWWLEIPPNPACTWPAGEYRMTTRWEIHLWAGIVLPVEKESNVFHLVNPVAAERGDLNDLARRLGLIEGIAPPVPPFP